MSNGHSKHSPTAACEVIPFGSSRQEPRSDHVVTEEPMEIRLLFGPLDRRVVRSLSITMRTPGDDRELAAGFLFTEGILTSPDSIEEIETRGVDHTGQSTGNILRVNLRPDVELDLSRLQRHFYTTSSCGVCGKASLEMLEIQGLQPIATQWQIAPGLIQSLPEKLRQAQPAFELTGGLHAASLADRQGHLLTVREDVGRHNAVDKLFGREFLQRTVPLHDRILVISGRISFEIMQKAVVAQVPLIVAVGAPTSLAIEVARKFNQTLIGFASGSRFNLYSGEDRIIRDPQF